MTQEVWSSIGGGTKTEQGDLFGYIRNALNCSHTSIFVKFCLCYVDFKSQIKTIGEMSKYLGIFLVHLHDLLVFSFLLENKQLH